VSVAPSEMATAAGQGRPAPAPATKKSTIDKMRDELDALRQEITELRGNPPRPDKDGDVDPVAQRQHTERLAKLNDDYRSMLTAVNNAERQEANKPEANAEREAAARRRQSTTPPEQRRASAEAFLQDLEDQRALGQITDAEATRRWEQYKFDTYTRPQQLQAQRNVDRAATVTRQQQAEQGRRQAGQDRRADARESRLVDSENRRTTMETNAYARQAGEKAVAQAQEGRNEERTSTYLRSRASGKSPQESIGASRSLPPLDLESIAERAVQRALQGLGAPTAPVRQPAAAGAGASPPPIAAQNPALSPDQPPYNTEQAMGRFGR
jgi:hypothetical protein